MSKKGPRSKLYWWNKPHFFSGKRWEHVCLIRTAIEELMIEKDGYQITRCKIRFVWELVSFWRGIRWVMPKPPLNYVYKIWIYMTMLAGDFRQTPDNTIDCFGTCKECRGGSAGVLYQVKDLQWAWCFNRTKILKKCQYMLIWVSGRRAWMSGRFHIELMGQRFI